MAPATTPGQLTTTVTWQSSPPVKTVADYEASLAAAVAAGAPSTATVTQGVNSQMVVTWTT